MAIGIPGVPDFGHCYFSLRVRAANEHVIDHMIRNVGFVIFWSTLLRPTAGAVLLFQKCIILQNFPYMRAYWIFTPCTNIIVGSCLPGNYCFEILRNYLPGGNYCFKILRNYLSAGNYRLEILRNYLSAGNYCLEILRNYLSAGNYCFEMLRNKCSSCPDNFSLFSRFNEACMHLKFELHRGGNNQEHRPE